MEPFKEKIWLSSPTMHGEELIYMQEAYEKNWMSTVGENINEVERLACEKVGCRYAVALSAGTAALHMAVKLAGVQPGEKVFCSDLTFDATVNPVVYEGGVPVFIDTEYDTWNMDPIALEKAFELYPEVRVVVVAHLYGTPGKVDEIRTICERTISQLKICFNAKSSFIRNTNSMKTNILFAAITQLITVILAYKSNDFSKIKSIKIK